MRLGNKTKFTAGLFLTTVMATMINMPGAGNAAEAAQLAAIKSRREAAERQAAQAQVATKEVYKAAMRNPINELADGHALGDTLVAIHGGRAYGDRPAFPVPAAGDAAAAGAVGNIVDRFNLLMAIEAAPLHRPGGGGRANDDAAKQGIRRALGLSEDLANFAETHAEVAAFINAIMLPSMKVVAENIEKYRSAVYDPLAVLNDESDRNRTLGGILIRASATAGNAAHNMVRGGTPNEKAGSKIAAMRALEAAGGPANDALKVQIRVALGVGNARNADTDREVQIFIKAASNARYMWALTHRDDIFAQYVPIIHNAVIGGNSVVNGRAEANRGDQIHRVAEIVDAAQAGGAHADDQQFTQSFLRILGLPDAIPLQPETFALIRKFLRASYQ